MNRSSLIRPLLMVGALLLAAIACMSSPAPTTVPTEPPPAVQPTDVEPTEAPTEPVAQQYYTESFDADTGQWSTFVVDATTVPTVVEGKVDNMSVGVSDGYLVFDLGSKNLWVYSTYDPYEYDDVRMDVVAENRGTNDNNISLICRFSKEEGWYEFNVANSGLYDILHGSFTKDGKVTYGKIADGGSNKIKQGKETNTYAISCKDRTLVLYINGYETRRLTDNQYALRKGKVGLSVSSFDTLPVKVAFDSVKISQP
jgi:hypothetical protein